MKKLFFLFAISLASLSMLNASSWSANAKTGQSNQYKTYNVDICTGTFQLHAEANGFGAFSDVHLYFKDGSHGQLWAHGWSGSRRTGANKTSTASGCAYKITVQAMTGEHGYFDCLAISACSARTIH